MITAAAILCCWAAGIAVLSGHAPSPAHCLGVRALQGSFPRAQGPFCMAVLGRVTSCLIPLICDPKASATGRDLGSQMIWSTWEELTSTRSQKASQQPRSRHKTQCSQLPAPQQDTSTCTLSHPPGQGLAHCVHCTEHTRTLTQTIWTRFVFSLRFM